MGLATAFGLIFYGMSIGVALAAPIGPINIEIIRRGIQGGYLHGWLVGLGALSSDTVFAAVIVSGLTPVADSPILRGPLFLAGAAMLIWVGLRSIHAALRGDAIDQTSDGGGRKSYLTGVLMAALNPMGIVYWLSVGAALVADAVERAGSAGSPLLVGGVFFGIFTWVTFLSWLALVARRFGTGRGMLYVTGGGGVALVGFGCWFLYQAFESFRDSSLW